MLDAATPAAARAATPVAVTPVATPAVATSAVGAHGPQKAAKPEKGKPGAHGHGETIVKRGSRKGHHDEHGGAWKVAFADFCLALLCLFLVLWLMAAREQERMMEILRAPGGNVMDEGQGRMVESLGSPRGHMIDSLPMPRFADASTGARKAPSADKPSRPASASTPVAAPADSKPRDADDRSESVKKRYESPADLQALSRVLARMSADAGLSSNLQTVITAYGLRVMLHDTDRQGMFERGSAVPSARFAGVLRRMGPLFAAMANQMLIVGHTDSQAYAGRGAGAFSNWNLSSNRAMAARAQLIEGGMAGDGILQVVGMADRAPIDTANARAGVNRRIELLILTGGQADTIAAMFGAPAHATPLIENVDSALPDREALQALRDHILKTRPPGVR